MRAWTIVVAAAMAPGCGTIAPDSGAIDSGVTDSTSSADASTIDSTPRDTTSIDAGASPPDTRVAADAILASDAHSVPDVVDATVDETSPSVDAGPPPPGTLFFTELGTGIVRSARLDGSDVKKIAKTMAPDGIVADPVAKRIYWADNGLDQILRMPYDASSPPLAVHTSASEYDNPRSVAVDPAAGKLFWTDGSVPPADPGYVFVAGLDGSSVVPLIASSFADGLGLDAVAGKVYWADNGTDSISRASYDGSAIEVLYTSSDAFSNPRGLAVDPSVGLMFWAEGSVVRSAHTDGTGVTTIAKGGAPWACAVVPRDGTVYWTDNGSDTVERASYDGSGRVVLFHDSDPYSNPAGVAVDPN